MDSKQHIWFKSICHQYFAGSKILPHMTSVYQFINKRINYNTKKFADTRFLTVWDGNRINYGKKYGYIKSSDLISE